MERARRLWAAVSSWLVPLAIVAVGAIDLAQNGSLSSEGAKAAFPGPVAVHAGFLLLVTVPLYWRRTDPVAVVVAVTGATAAWILSMFNPAQQPPFEPALASYVALFALSSTAEGWPLLVGTAVAGSVLATGEIVGGLAGQGVGNVLPALLTFSASWGMGRIVHEHRQRANRQGHRADRLEHEQEQRSRRAAELERARIARELHDVIAHSLSVIVVQAAAERRVIGERSGSTAAVLESIEATGRQTMTELRRLLGVLRKDDMRPLRSPQPGLGQLSHLVTEVAEAGVSVHVTTEGDITRIPPGLDLSAYRIVQECLTNVLRHAHATRAEVQIACRRHHIEIDVSDDGAGTGAPQSGGGFGLVGMRERVAVYGGRINAGGVDGGGYRVHAVLPLEPGELARP